MELLAEQGIKAGLIRPISLWPFPYKAFDALGKKTKAGHLRGGSTWAR